MSTHFSDMAKFDEAKFYDQSYFWGATFSGDAYFTRAIFYEKVYFSDSNFSMHVNFSDCDFRRGSKFIACLYSEKAAISFENVMGFSNMQIEWEYDPEKFDKVAPTNKILRRGLKNHLKYNETFYIALFNNYRDMGWYNEADDCYYTYRVEKRKHRKNNLIKARKNYDDKKVLNFQYPLERLRLGLEWLFLDRSFGYGVKPLILLKSYVFLWLVFIPIYVFFLRLQYQNGQKTIWHWLRKFLRSSVHSLDTLTPGINLYAFTELHPFYFDTMKNWKKILLNIFHRCQQVLGWYLAALFLILFSRVFIR